MSVFTTPDFDDHRQVTFFRDPDTGLKAIIALHDLTLGPALGGCRMYPYASEADALADVLRLSRGMTYKAAIAGVRLGGGKSVIIGDSRRDKSEALLRAMGRAIASLGGRYIVGEDIGTNPADMAVLRKETDAVSCLDQADGGYGDPAPMTALGVFQSIRAAALHRWRAQTLEGVTVAIQGVGNVGFSLAGLLAEAGARLVVTDTYAPNLQRAVEAFGARPVEPDAIFAAGAEVFAPCATGGVINDGSLAQLEAEIVAGAANNQLASPGFGDVLRARGVTYVPDYVSNGGGLVSCAAEWYRSDPEQIVPDVLKIHETVLAVLRAAEAAGIPSNIAADRMAQARLRGAAA